MKGGVAPGTTCTTPWLAMLGQSASGIPAGRVGCGVARSAREVSERAHVALVQEHHTIRLVAEAKKIARRLEVHEHVVAQHKPSLVPSANGTAAHMGHRRPRHSTDAPRRRCGGENAAWASHAVNSGVWRAKRSGARVEASSYYRGGRTDNN